MPVVTTLGIAGMTCGHCVSSVTNELETVDGVEHVSVELRTGAVSDVTVLSHEPLDEAALRAAVVEAGYEVGGLDVVMDAIAEQGRGFNEQREEFAAQHPTA
ncbi:Copper chaperone CopZ [Sanguibacter gelidistatuariae]|uniref:Copper chaperone CopZ n=1 Tax=Sanguibacter gelidistatuariae TaxID=1814289 RepID=A0A1G6H8F3_9MICO|nr:heavy-metal-associated domain-containing protein [Sanguibacter gelidistatuariae]SDB90225.1 Copper chaperone CopZ [Sanguibacter gelidistatuariae]